MPWSPPPTPTIGEPYTLGALTWEWNGTGWSRVLETQPGQNTFQSPAMQGWYETLIEAAPSPVSNMTGVLLTYL